MRKMRKVELKVKVILAIILFLGLVVRIWGIDFGLPMTSTRPDESTMIDAALRFGTGDLNPHTFLYPTFFSYLLFVLYIIYFVFGFVVGKYVSVVSLVTEFGLDPTNFYLIARFVSVIFGVATVFITYKLSKRLFGERTALISSFFLSLTYLHVRESHFAKVDVIMTFFITLSVLLVVKSYANRDLRSYLLAGVTSGLAVASKYVGALVVFSMLTAHLLRVVERKRGRIKAFFDKQIVGYFGVLVATFVLVVPYAVIDFQTFWLYVRWIGDFTSRPWYGVGVGSGWFYHLQTSLFYGLGWTLFSFSLLGIVFLVKKRKKTALVLFSFPFFYYLLIGRAFTAVVRFVVPCLPFLCISAAYAVEYLRSKVQLKLKIKSIDLVYILLVLLIVMPSLDSIYRFNYLLAQRDNRLLAFEWIEGNIKSGSSVYQVGLWLGRIPFPVSASLFEEQKNRIDEELFSNELLRNMKVRVVTERNEDLISRGSNGFDEWKFDENVDKFTFMDRVQESIPRYIVLYDSPLELDRIMSPVPGTIRELLNESYHLISSFSAIDVSDKKNIFDPQDAFYLPFAGFSNVKRPGPNIYIYMRDNGAYK